mmetsp:Transcript_23111/g.33116  ORF Transcript_23111/g.33116 Transcript_23111/m.33116 type:complete len:411 (+) Transcript_23111:58-1290(+)
MSSGILNNKPTWGATNPWGTHSTKSTRWVDLTINEEVSTKWTTASHNPFIGSPVLPHKTFGQPKLTLGNWYYKRYQILLTNDCFECTNNGAASHVLKWTCTFDCPITGNTFKSGQYTGADETRFSVDDEKIVWYDRKKEAEHASAARALDCLNFMEKIVLETAVVEYHSYCKEDPIVPPIPYPPHVDKTNQQQEDSSRCSNTTESVNNTMIRVMEVDFSDLNINTAIPQDSNSLTNHAEVKTRKLKQQPPKQSLAQWYMSKYKVSLRNDAYECEDDGNSLQHLQKWTCTLTCPLTGNIFKSGTTSGSDAAFVFKNHIWYKTKKEAEHAAAARALDCLRFYLRDTNHETNNNNNNMNPSDENWSYYCKEEPFIPLKPYPPFKQWKTNTSSTSDMTMDEEFSADDYRLARNS